jgi:aromatic ring-opening dioxygenase catalytic subunit (LigB family)
MFDTLEASLKDLPRQVGGKPKAVLSVSGHWEEREPAVMSGAHPPMVYDYGGFPEHTYHIRYPAPGSPEVAARVQALLQSAGFPARLDPARGFDHGTFAPLAAIFPEADVPVLQLSLRRDLDPAAHLAMGRALAPLRKEGVLILGSGLSYHNLRMMGPAAADPSRRFDAWLRETLLASTPEERTRRLIGWSQAPAARAAHPREDHLIPLMVAVGAAEGEGGTLVYHEDGFMGGVTASSFRFGAAAAEPKAEYVRI